ncbi:hypothetical protein B0H98_101713 [Vreelandella songnenensis]|uniref:DUF3108 domain-containing protein n=1 Tax=Vreelandella songnenensis TaxID=1176243 RepID=A0A2T0V9I6_9GAMM|nr:hypothetical protein [Halomonas songnenensis]PRY66718.1 hypothetical protein B0H98_101713 [Halomonas songnenensis]
MRTARLTPLLGATCLSLLAFQARAGEEPPQALADLAPFEAKYRLETRSWPSATITHTLSQEGLHWLSDMRFSVAIARGQEYSRFSDSQDTIRSLLYSSSYSLLGVGDSYQLTEADIPSIDRQAALVDLSRRAGHESCTQSAPCDLEFVDHRGRDEHFQYYAVEGLQTVNVPAGEFEVQQVVLNDVEKPDRFLELNFHPDWPGLIVSAEYLKEGKRQTRIRLTSFTP